MCSKYSTKATPDLQHRLLNVAKGSSKPFGPAPPRTSGFVQIDATDVTDNDDVPANRLHNPAAFSRARSPPTFRSYRRSSSSWSTNLKTANAPGLTNPEPFLQLVG